jgi:hypothetical protein
MPVLGQHALHALRLDIFHDQFHGYSHGGGSEAACSKSSLCYQVSPQNVTLTAPSSSTDSASQYSTKSRCSGNPKKSQFSLGTTQGSFGAAFGHTSRKKIGRFPCLYYGTTSYTTCQQRPFACCALLPFLLRYHSCFDFAGHRFLYYIN